MLLTWHICKYGWKLTQWKLRLRCEGCEKRRGRRTRRWAGQPQRKSRGVSPEEVTLQTMTSMSTVGCCSCEVIKARRCSASHHPPWSNISGSLWSTQTTQENPNSTATWPVLWSGPRSSKGFSFKGSWWFVFIFLFFYWGHGMPRGVRVWLIVRGVDWAQGEGGGETVEERETANETNDTEAVKDRYRSWIQTRNTQKERAELFHIIHILLYWHFIKTNIIWDFFVF